MSVQEGQVGEKSAGTGAALALVSDVAPGAAINSQIDRTPLVGHEPEEQARLAAHVVDEGVHVPTTRADVLLREQSRHRPDVRLARLDRLGGTVHRDVARDRVGGLDAEGDTRVLEDLLAPGAGVVPVSQKASSRQRNHTGVWNALPSRRSVARTAIIGS